MPVAATGRAVPALRPSGRRPRRVGVGGGPQRVAESGAGQGRGAEVAGGVCGLDGVFERRDRGRRVAVLFLGAAQVGQVVRFGRGEAEPVGGVGCPAQWTMAST